MTRKNVGTPKTVEEAAFRYIAGAGSAVQTKAVTKEVARKMQTTENTVAQALTKLKAAKKLTQPRKGLWATAESGDLDQEEILVEEDVVAPEAAIIFFDPESDEVWFTIELSSRLVVHKPKQIRSRMMGRRVEAEFG